MMYLLYMLTTSLVVFVLILLFKKVLKPFLLGFNSRMVIIVFFFGLLFACFIGGFFSKQNTSQAENRNLAKWKPLKKTDIINVPRQIDVYVNDHFGFRDKFIGIYRYFQLNFLGQSLTEKVTIGRNNWLFYTKAIQVCYEEKSLTKNEIQQTQLVKKLKDLELDLKERGIKLVILIMPSKPYIHTEYLPLWVDISKNKRSTIDNFVELIKGETSIPILDLFDTLLEAKKIENNNLYYSNDSHWNSVGAYYAWKKVLSFFNENGITHHSIDFNDYIQKPDPFKGGLSGIMGNVIIDNNTGYFLKTKKVKNRIYLCPQASKKYNIRNGKNLKRELSVSYKNIEKAETTIPIIIADSYFMGSAFTRDIPFDKYYSMHYHEIANGLPFLLQNQNDQEVVILSFVDRGFVGLLKGFESWNSNKQTNYKGPTWKQPLPY